MFKLVFLFAVLIAVVVSATASPHPRQSHPKKATALQKKHSVATVAHHGRPAAYRVARSHSAHASVHHQAGPAAGHHHASKHGNGAHGSPVHGGKHPSSHGSHSAAHRPVKHRGHHK